MEGADHDLIHVAGILLQGFVEDATGLVASFSAVLDLHDEQQVRMALIEFCKQLVSSGDLQAHFSRIGDIPVDALAVRIFEIVAKIVRLQLCEGHVADIVAVFLIFAQRDDLLQTQIAVDVAGFIDICVVVVDQMTVLRQVQIAFDDVHTDGVNRLPEGEQRVPRIVALPPRCAAMRGSCPLPTTKGDVSTFFSGGRMLMTSINTMITARMLRSILTNRCFFMRSFLSSHLFRELLFIAQSTGRLWGKAVFTTIEEVWILHKAHCPFA